MNATNGSGTVQNGKRADTGGRTCLKAELRPDQVTTICDTREQHPWNVSPLKMERGTLQTGDYTIKGCEDLIRLERKTLDDLLGCIGAGRDRFDREIERLLAFPTRAIIVESAWQVLESGSYRSRVNPRAAVGSCLGWIACGVPMIFAGDCERAQQYASRLLFICARRRWREARALISNVTEDATA